MAGRPAKPDPDSDGPAADGQRLDKWLWFTRVVKSRTLATTLVGDGKVRVNRQRVDKPSHTLRVGDVVTLAVHRQVRVLRVAALGVRRGPAVEAQGLYEDLSPKPAAIGEPPGTSAPGEPSRPGSEGVGVRDAGAGRPTKRERRQTDRLRGGDDEVE